MKILGSLLMVLLWTGAAFAFSQDQRIKGDTLKAHQYIEDAKNNFGTPRVADSLGQLAFKLAGNYFPMKGESAHVILYANLNTNFEKAQQWADTAIYYFQKSKNDLWCGYALRTVGYRAQQINRNDLAIRTMQQSLVYFEKAHDTVMEAQNHVSLSLLYHNNLQDYKNGLEHGKES